MKSCSTQELKASMLPILILSAETDRVPLKKKYIRDQNILNTAVCLCNKCKGRYEFSVPLVSFSFTHVTTPRETNFACLNTGHKEEISKAALNPQGDRLLTASSDNTCRLWDTSSGKCLQVLEGHEDEIFSCAFNYEGKYIITGSKDNTCRIWSTYQA